MAIQRVGVVGCGLMGAGIAQVSAQSGFTTVVREVSPELVEKGIKSVEKNLARLVEKGVITEAAKGEIRGRLKGSTSLEDLKDCDVVVEAQSASCSLCSTSFAPHPRFSPATLLR